MAKQILEVEADSVSQAKEEIKNKMPAGFHVLFTQIIDEGRMKTVTRIADTVEDAILALSSLEN